MNKEKANRILEWAMKNEWERVAPDRIRSRIDGKVRWAAFHGERLIAARQAFPGDFANGNFEPLGDEVALYGPDAPVEQV